MKPTKFPSPTSVDCSMVTLSNIMMTKRHPSSTCFSPPESADSESLVKKKPKLSCPSEIQSDLKEGIEIVEVEVEVEAKGKDSDGLEALVSKEADEKREGAEKKPVFDFDLNMKPVELGHGIVIDSDGDDHWYSETDPAKEEKGTSLRGERKRYTREEKEKEKVVDDDDDDGRCWLRLGLGSLSSLTNKRMRYTKEEKGKGKVDDDDDDDDRNVWLSLGMGLVSLDAALTSGSIDLNGSNSDGES
ncbi:hypothetical protein CMV_005865 [Castanea mollissima]|uniref:Uncharacterized protein n=1 Tax=Castanea mollissima TaxID=60419 RepID=A0A8J4RQ29_9ROSI|nr:hypothetical protein CMV_005865 [Castanea mollissima]